MNQNEKVLTLREIYLTGNKPIKIDSDHGLLTTRIKNTYNFWCFNPSNKTYLKYHSYSI
jgi:hypothetical protein